MEGVAHVGDAGDAAGAIFDGVGVAGRVGAQGTEEGAFGEGDCVAGRNLNGAMGGQFVRGTVLGVAVSRVGRGVSRRTAEGLHRASWHRARDCPGDERRQATSRPPTCSIGGLYWSSSSW